jgi:hypothetical protein
VDLINTDGSNPAQNPVIQVPFHSRAHRSINRVPTRVKASGDLLPCEATCPGGQEMSEIVRHPLFALGPPNALDLDPTALAIHAPHGVLEEDSNAPKRDVLKVTRSDTVLGRSLARAARANGPIAHVRS